MTRETALLSIGEAAKRAGVSRRTLERRIRDGILPTVPDKVDGRKRLVRWEDVRAALGSHVDRPHKPQMQRDRETIDEALRIIYTYHLRLMMRLYPDAVSLLTLRQVREGPLGRDLDMLAKYARGESDCSPDDVLEAVSGVLQLLFHSPGAEDYTVPRAFWQVDLGKILIRAKYRAYGPRELMTIDQAEDTLGVSRSTIYRWIDERTLEWARDPSTDRTFVVRRDVERLREQFELFGDEREQFEYLLKTHADVRKVVRLILNDPDIASSLLERGLSDVSIAKSHRE